MSDYIRKIREKIGHDPLLICGASVIVFQEGKVLLQRRKDDGMWGIIGGCVELYEKVEDAARRELFEETGLTARKLEFFDIFSGADMTHTYPNHDQVSIIDIVYICTDFTGEIISSTDETIDCRWFAVDGLPGKITFTNIGPLDRFIRERVARWE